MTESDDTIAAIATPAGTAGIGVIRVSGPLSKPIATAIASNDLTPRHAHFCKFKGAGEEIIDQGIAIYFKAPASFTGEDTLELFAHGGRTLLELLLQRVIDLGARYARPGEFTERAFINEKIDLLQAEAIADVIESRSSQAAKSAMRSLEGVFSRKINRIQTSLTTIRTFCEASLDFPDEEIEPRDRQALSENLENCRNAIHKLLANAKTGKRLREGTRIVITGKPNVGKSSVMNCLLGSDRSIVTATPGTTRDVITAPAVLDGVHIELVDTAGIRDTRNEIEREGVKRAQEQIMEADIVLRVVDGDEAATNPANGSVMSHTMLVKNKIDLYGLAPQIKTGKTEPDTVFISAKNKTGIDLLLDMIKKRLGRNNSEEDVLLARQRHINALKKAAEELGIAVRLTSPQTNLVLIAEHLRRTQHYLDEITGKTCPEELLGEIFASFCIGK